MQATLLILCLSLLAANPCAPGVSVATSCGDIDSHGCCTDSNSVQWCEDGVLCELSCAEQPACGWRIEGGIYDCGTLPASDPTCQFPFSCKAPGCAATFEQAGACGAPCEACVCAQDPYCCEIRWDITCVTLCELCGGCGSLGGCVPSSGPGCLGCDCEACVCAEDPTCCSDKWDTVCAARCQEHCNGSCNGCLPNCSGKECGTDGCGGSCGTCQGTESCQGGQCMPPCIASCVGKECGSDGCGGSCGVCPTGFQCSDVGQCVEGTCVPNCVGKECGDDGCGESCGMCGEDESCQAGLCVDVACTPACNSKECGPDGCGGSCGLCPAATACNDAGQCESFCQPVCVGKECGNDGCNGSCGECEPGLVCQDFQCQPPCFVNCNGVECGTDHCGGSCGTCPATKPQCAFGTCVSQCTPLCQSAVCGDDGCGGSCGECAQGEFCVQGTCQLQCEPQCKVPPFLLDDKACGWDECPGYGVCGVCPPGRFCSTGFVCIPDACACDGVECGVPSPDCPSCGDCSGGMVCDEETHSCQLCQPDCYKHDGILKECGADGCGGECGECPAGTVCDEDADDLDGKLFECELCHPQCPDDAQCGADGCGGTCGSCEAGLVCDEATYGCVECVGQCNAPPDFQTPMECGPNACPAGCMAQGSKPCKFQSDCDSGTQCNALTGRCVECGSCGECPPGTICDVSLEDDPDIYICEVCVPNCAGKECGSNGCGGVCGACPFDFQCGPDNICQEKEDPCQNLECGDDGAGGSCGDCEEGWECLEGQCIENPIPDAARDIVEVQADTMSPEVNLQDAPIAEEAVDTGESPTCPPGTRWYYNQCVEETPDESGGKNGCSHSAGESTPWGVLLLLVGAIVFLVGRRAGYPIIAQKKLLD